MKLPKILSGLFEGVKFAEDFDRAAKEFGVLPVKISDFYAAKVAEEIAALRRRGFRGDEGPLFRCVLPGSDRFSVRVAGEVSDFIGDAVNMPDELTDVLIWKYADRVLFLPTDRCASNCQYCFRTAYLSDRYGEKPFSLPQKVSKLVEFLQTHPQVTEVILSGGDPMVMSFSDLEMILKALREDARVSHIRIHSRALVYSPFVYSQRTCELLARYRVRLVHHVTHPYEICEVVRQHVGRLAGAGVRQYNQFPLLRGVNDHVDVLRDLIIALDELGIRTLSIFAPDAVNFSAPFRISLRRQFSLMDQLFLSTPAWVHSARYVLDNPSGKVRQQDFVKWEKDDDGRCFAIFRRGDKIVKYPDFPVELDVPGKREVMMWKETPLADYVLLQNCNNQ